jgi:hypothetical protein
MATHHPAVRLAPYFGDADIGAQREAKAQGPGDRVVADRVD